MSFLLRSKVCPHFFFPPRGSLLSSNVACSVVRLRQKFFCSPKGPNHRLGLRSVLSNGTGDFCPVTATFHLTIALKLRKSGVVTYLHTSIHLNVVLKHRDNFHGCVIDQAVIHRGGLCSMPGKLTGDLRWPKWHGDGISPRTSVLLLKFQFHLCSTSAICIMLSVYWQCLRVNHKLPQNWRQPYTAPTNHAMSEHIRGRSALTFAHDATSCPGIRADWRSSNTASTCSGRTWLESRLFCLRLFLAFISSFWGPPSLLYNGYRVFAPGKTPRACRWPPTPI